MAMSKGSQLAGEFKDKFKACLALEGKLPANDHYKKYPKKKRKEE